MKKQILIILFLVFVVLLSSCSLLKCQHKRCTEQTVAATCTSEGYTIHTCEKCGESYTDNQVAALGHNYTDAVIAPNCFEEGYTQHTCTACGDSYNDSNVAKTQHYFAGEACPNCGMEEITDNIIPDTEWYSESTAVFNITTAEQLAGFAFLVNSGTDFAERIVYLDADIDLGFYEWIPIGNADFAFNGTFDGDGHTVFGLKINANYDYVGLFGSVSGKVCNVTIDQANVYVKRDYNYVSVLCGYSTGEITEIVTKGFVEAPKANYVGAIAGATEPTSIIYSNLTNDATINAANCVGGLFGYINSTGSIQTDSISNTGDITGVSQVGGIVGYANAAIGSNVYAASVSADISGKYFIGGIAGKLDNVTVSSCTNDGSTVTATSYFAEGENFYAWLGGYVGAGYSVENCVNNIDISYTGRGDFIGGIIGFAVGDVQNCTNNGDITTYTNCVGGIAGEVNSPIGKNLNNLANTGNISGYSIVGGVVGSYKKILNEAGAQWYQNVRKSSCHIITCSKTQYYHHYQTTVTISDLSNSGKVTASANIAGGVIGNLNVDNAYAVDNKCHDKSAHSYYCTIMGDVGIVATGFVNNGEVVSADQAGEIFGNFASDAPSTLTTYTVTGKVTINGEVLEGEYDVGSNSNLTLSDREGLGSESTDIENTETTE